MVGGGLGQGDKAGKRRSVLGRKVEEMRGKLVCPVYVECVRMSCI